MATSDEVERLRRSLRRTLGENIRARRLRMGFTQERLAGEIGMSAETVAKVEGGRQWVSDASAARIALALGVPPGVLFCMPRRDGLVAADALAGAAEPLLALIRAAL